MARSVSQGGQPPLAPRRGKVTVVGAGFYGSTTAQRLAEYDIFDEVVLTDIIEGKPEGLALDMNQSRPVTLVSNPSTGRDWFMSSASPSGLPSMMSVSTTSSKMSYSARRCAVVEP